MQKAVAAVLVGHAFSCFYEQLLSQPIVARFAAAVGAFLGIRLRFHNHAPEQAVIGLAFHQPATDEVGGDQLGRASKTVWGRAGGCLVMDGMGMGAAWAGMGGG